jgi:TonB family protein
MSDAGGGPDWPMQYSLKNHAQSGAGMLVPPFAQKKVAANMSRAQLAGERGPVFITGTIDEAGKVQSLRSVRAQDSRAETAIQALQQWEFLPAQLDGRPVASKILIGVTVAEE